ncbi:MAG: DRTGG domain-containing protein [bacterium]
MGRIYYIGSTSAGSGRSLTAWMVAEALLGQGLRPGFVKCIPESQDGEEQLHEDADVVLFRDLLGRERSRPLWPLPAERTPSPGEAPGLTIEGAAARIREWADSWGSAVVMGSARIFSDSLSRPISEISLIQRLRAEVFLLDRYEAEADSIYSLLSLQSLLKGLTRCLILNRVPFGHPVARLPGIQRLRAGEKHIPPIALIPEDSMLSSLSVGEIGQALPARIMSGEETAGRRFCRVSLGAQHLHGSLRVFRHALGRVLLLAPPDPGAPRLDGMEAGSVAGILLAGPRLPSPALLEAARAAHISLMHTELESFAALERLQNILVSVRSGERYKKERFAELVLRDLGVPDILACNRGESGLDP